MSFPSRKSRWLTPFLLVLLFFGVGIFSSLLNSADVPEGLRADVSETERTKDIMAEDCSPRNKTEVRDCEFSSTEKGKQIWWCNEQEKWERWGACIAK